MGCICHLRNIFVSDKYLAVICEVVVAVGCIVVDMGKNVGSVCLFSIIAVCVTLAILQPYLLNDIYKIYCQ